MFQFLLRTLQTVVLCLPLIILFHMPMRLLNNLNSNTHPQTSHAPRGIPGVCSSRGRDHRSQKPCHPEPLFGEGSLPLRWSLSAWAEILRFAQNDMIVDVHTNHSSYRSFHSGFIESIKSIFFARSQPLICFSRSSATCMVGVDS